MYLMYLINLLRFKKEHWQPTRKKKKHLRYDSKRMKNYVFIVVLKLQKLRITEVREKVLIR